MKQPLHRWRVAALLATGMAVGIALTATPATSHVAGWAHNWSTHIRPKADARYYTKTQANVRYYTKAQANDRFLPGGTLPTGATIRGVYRTTGNDQGAGTTPAASPIHFGYTLASEPTSHFIPVGVSPPPGCAGTAASPQAAAGHLCVYEQLSVNTAATAVTQVSGMAGATRWGAILFTQSAADGDFATAGAWAVTAP